MASPRTLGDVARIQGGYAFRSCDFDKVGIPVIKIGDVSGGGVVTYSGLDCVSEEIASTATAYLAEPHDTLIAMTGANVGKVSRVGLNSPRALINQRVGRVIPIPQHGYSKDFLHFVVSSQEAYDFFRNTAYGSAQPNISTSLIETLSIPPYEKDEANHIGSIFQSLDDKIDLNRRMNETLEAMARAIFKDWFVDFGPTRAKMEGRPPYLAQEIWDLFPDSLDDEGKPVGWASHQLKDIAEHCKGSVTPNNHPEQTFEHYSLPAYDSGCAPAFDLGITIKSNKTPIPEGAILLSKLNPDIPRVWIPEAQNTKQKISSTEFLVFRSKKPVGRSLLFCLFSDTIFRSTMQGMVTGTSKSHQRVSPPALLELQVISGSSRLFRSFESIATPFLEQVVANRDASRTLAQTRELLLPKLMSGEIRVKDAENTVGAVL